MKPIYLNEPLVQKLPVFYNFMGGLDFVRSVARLNKLTAEPRQNGWVVYGDNWAKWFKNKQEALLELSVRA